MRLLEIGIFYKNRGKFIMSSFTITVIFIALSTMVALVIKMIHRDKCLKGFTGDTVTLEQLSGKIVWGRLRVENTGLELLYPNKHKDKQGHDEASYILYKYEYPNIQALIRFHDDLTENGRKERDRELKRTYHPRLLQRLKRKIQNLIRTARDAMAEVLNVLISRAKKSSAVGSTLTTQDKYVSQIKQEVIGSVGTSYEPLLEKYIGHKVVLELMKGDKVSEYPGVLKDYTAEFIAVMDVNYKIREDKAIRKADLVVLRKYGVVRHLGE